MRALLLLSLLILPTFASAASECDVPQSTSCRSELRAVRRELVPQQPFNRWLARSGHAGARCQVAASRAAKRFLEERVEELGQAERATDAGRHLGEVARQCRGVRASRLTRFGGACAQLARPGDTLRGGSLSRCLRASLEAAAQAAVSTPVPPNIVLILTDDQRWDTLDIMPQVQRELVDRGVRFTNGFVPTSACCPSRASLFSGLYAHKHGILTNAGLFLPHFAFDHEDVLPAWLRRAGYATALFGKYLNHAYLLGETKPDAWSTWQIFTGQTGRYFDYELNKDGVWSVMGGEEEDYSTDYLAREAIRFVRENSERPFFVMYAPFAPHAPATPAPRHVGALAGLGPYRPPNFREEDLSGKPAWLRFFRVIAPTPDAYDALRISQLESLLAVDEAVGELSRVLDELGLTDNTVVLYLSDNGLQWGSHWWNEKWTPYEESIRVPFVLRYPRSFPLARESHEMVLNIDIAPTLMAAAGLPAPPADGRDILPVV